MGTPDNRRVVRPLKQSHSYPQSPLFIIIATRATYDFEGAKGALECIEDFLDNAGDCTELVPALDQLMGLSGQHPGAWEPHFKVMAVLENAAE